MSLVFDARRLWMMIQTAENVYNIVTLPEIPDPHQRHASAAADLTVEGARHPRGHARAGVPGAGAVSSDRPLR